MSFSHSDRQLAFTLTTKNDRLKRRWWPTQIQAAHLLSRVIISRVFPSFEAESPTLSYKKARPYLFAPHVIRRLSCRISLDATGHVSFH